MLNKKIDKNKVFIIEISNYCINKCDGCIYTTAQRKDNFFMSINDFNIILNFIKEYSEKTNLDPHILLGTGEVLNEFTIDYINLIEDKFKNKKKTIEIATTARTNDFTNIIDNIINKINIDKTRLIIEIVLDGFQKDIEEQKIINENINYCNIKNLEIHSVLKTSINYNNNIEKIVENIKNYNLKYITLDYVFLNNTKKIINFNSISDYFFNFDKLLKEKTNINLINYLEDYNYNGEYQYRNFGFYITKELNIETVIEVPFGDLIINKLNTDYSLNINLKNDIYSVNKIQNLEKLIYLQNKLLSEKIDLCSSCLNKKTCCIFLVKKLMDCNNIKYENDCLGGKKILDYFTLKYNI